MGKRETRDQHEGFDENLKMIWVLVEASGRMQQKARVAPIDHPGFNKRTLREH